MILFRRTVFFFTFCLLSPLALSQNADPGATLSTENPLPENLPSGAIPTVIESNRAEVQTLEHETEFTFTGNVRVTGNNLIVLCEKLQVFSLREPAEAEAATSADPGDAGELVSPGRIRLILATGNVRIRQDGREAASGRAEVWPIKGEVILTESPVIRDEQGVVAGETITFYRGEKRAVVDGGESGPARITLPTLPDLGVDAETDSAEDADRGN